MDGDVGGGGAGLCALISDPGLDGAVFSSAIRTTNLDPILDPDARRDRAGERGGRGGVVYLSSGTDSADGEAVEASPCSDGKHVPICAGDLCIMGEDVTLLLAFGFGFGHCVCAGAGATCTGAGTGMGRGRGTGRLTRLRALACSASSEARRTLACGSCARSRKLALMGSSRALLFAWCMAE